jgi:hypothetical protein
MLSCAEFRLSAGSAPQRLGWATQLHRWMCPGCARYLGQMRRLDARIRRAFTTATKAEVGDRNWECIHIDSLSRAP